ncbi:hypothetical protein BDQ17DRAFT_1384458, partial [Cyathus striatus]
MYIQNFPFFSNKPQPPRKCRHSVRINTLSSVIPPYDLRPLGRIGAYGTIYNLSRGRDCL